MACRSQSLHLVLGEKNLRKLDKLANLDHKLQSFAYMKPCDRDIIKVKKVSSFYKTFNDLER